MLLWLRQWLRRWLMGDLLARLEALEARLCCLDGRALGSSPTPSQAARPPAREPRTFTMEARQ